MNKHWKLVNGKMVKRRPDITTDSDVSADGLTVTYTTTKTVTLNIEQLKRLCTADKPLMTGMTREGGLKMLSGLIRKHRYELFDTCEGYKIITNGYGQFKEIQFGYGKAMKAVHIFNKLEHLYPLVLD